jgi:hypothetical protein
LGGHDKAEVLTIWLPKKRCAEAKTLQGSDNSAERPHAVGSCLVYAIDHSPLALIRTLLELGADPNAPVDDSHRSLPR